MESNTYYLVKQELSNAHLKAIEDNYAWIYDGIRPTMNMKDFESPEIIEVMHSPGMFPEPAWLARQDHKQKIIDTMRENLLGANKCKWQWAVTHLGGSILSNVDVYGSPYGNVNTKYDLETIWNWYDAFGYLAFFYAEDGHLEYRLISGRNYGEQIGKILAVTGLAE